MFKCPITEECVTNIFIGLILLALGRKLFWLFVGGIGFIAGGYISIIVSALMSFNAEQLLWLFFIIGGIIGAVLMFLIFDWALILISSLSGASLIVQTTELGHDMEMLVFTVLVIIGMIIQTILMRQNRRSEAGN